jgi:hypothetical protein
VTTENAPDKEGEVMELRVGGDVLVTLVFNDGRRCCRSSPATPQEEEEGEWPLKLKKIRTMAALTMGEDEMRQRRQFDLALASFGGLSWTKHF